MINKTQLDIGRDNGTDADLNDTNSSTGEAGRPKVADETHQCLIYMILNQRSIKRATKPLIAVNDACWRSAA